MQRSLDEVVTHVSVPPTGVPEAGILDRIDDLERRVSALEHHEPVAASVAIPVIVEVAAPELPVVPTGMAAILGRLLLALAGAYLLRALAESGPVPRIAVVIAALLYAGIWLATAVRSYQAFGAGVHAITAALIMAPLLWENTVRVPVLSTEAAALILVLFVVAGCGLAWKSQFVVIHRVMLLSSAGTALVLLMATHDLIPFTLALLGMAFVSEYAACQDRFFGERWIAAGATNVALLVLAYILSRPHGVPENYRTIPAMTVAAVEGLALLIYFGSTAYRTLVRGLRIRWFEAIQGTIVFACSIGGALLITGGAAGIGLGALCAAIGVVAYGAAFGFRRESSEPLNLHVYSIWGLTAMMAGSLILLTGAPLTAIWSILAILAMVAAGRIEQSILAIVLRFHACAYLVAAFVVSGLLRYCFTASVAVGTSTASAVPAAFIAAGALAICYAMPGRIGGFRERIAAGLMADLLCWSLLAFASGLVVALQNGASGMVTARTAMLCAAAIGMAYAGARSGRGELTWLQYPLLIAGGVKLVLEDFATGRPAELALSLLFYGGTLIVLPRLRLGVPSTRPI